MRWTRHQADASLGELMEEQPDEAGPTAEDTLVRPTEPAGTAEPAETLETEPDDSFLDDEDYLPQERRGPGRLTVALVAALVLAVGVLGGVWVQKQLGTTATAAGFGARQGAPGAGAGAGAGTGTGTGQRGYGGAGAGTAGADGAGGGTGGGTDQSSTTGPGTTATPAVVGTLTTAGKKSLVVTDLGGTKHTVTLTETTTVTTGYAHGALKAGDTVAVAGTAAADGSVTATGITVT